MTTDEAIKELCSVVPTSKSRAREIINSLLSSSHDLLRGEVEKLKEEAPSEADDSAWPIIVEKVNAKLDAALALISKK